MRRRSTPNDGFALVIVLWAGVLLSAVAASFALDMRAETRRAGDLLARAKAEAIADAGVRRGIVALLSDSSGPRRESGGSVYELPFADGSMRIRMTSEEGKIDLNRAPDALIEGLLRALFESGELDSETRAASIADAILDWRDTDQWVRTYGAEDRTYAASGIALGARDGPFLSVTELNLVLGVDAEVFARLAPWVTVHSRSSQVDPVTAPRTVLLAVPGLDAETVDRFIAARNAWRAGEGTVREGRGHLPVEMLSAGERFLSANEARVYTIDAVGVLPDGARASRRAVVQLTGLARKPFTTIAWFDAIPDSESDEFMPRLE
jgi:general secretion pathway protein K